MTLTVDDWVALEQQPGAAGAVSRRIHPESDRDLYVALDLATRSRRLVYRLPWPPGKRLPDLPKTQALEAVGRLEAGGTALVMTVELREPSLADVFTAVVVDLARSVVDAASDGEALGEFTRRLASWQELFRALAPRGLGDLERRGLVAELLVLRDDILPLVSEATAVDAWTGPLRKNQDFQFSNVALEVKATAGLNPQGFVVSNERELDEQGAGHLNLIHIALDERRGGDGVNLNDLVAQVEGLLDGHPTAAQVFSTRLARVGYVKNDSDLYNEPRYEVRARRYYDVNGAFPRIVETDLREGVGKVRYAVSLAACAAYEVRQSDVHSRIKCEGVQ